MLADVGCGAGRAILKLAEAFPNSSFVGYDAFEGQLERAHEHAKAAGFGDRVRFELLDGSQGLPDTYEIVTTFDVIHDAVDPEGLVRAIHAGTKPDSVFYCMTTSLANGGAGLGTCGMPEAKVRELGTTAGFGSVERLPIENPFNAIYELRA